MVDPLSDFIALLRPRAVFSKVISGAGSWAVRYTPFGRPSFCAVLDGSCVLKVNGHSAITISAGDFVLLPETPGFTMSSFQPARPVLHDSQAMAKQSGSEVRHGTPDVEPDVRQLGGYFDFESEDAALLVSLLPPVIHVQGVERLVTLVRMVNEESREQRSGRDLVLKRLVELLLVEALRAGPADSTSPSLLRGLSDERVAMAMRQMHGDPSKPWTLEQLAEKAALSRSTFCDRFMRAVGIPPMEYLLSWRMALAKDLLRREGCAIAEVAERVGYGSASTFSTAFSRHVGQAPGRYARAGVAPG
jgi:AraC-like DNA-binding protein